MSQALYRKWRPHLWNEVVGQDHIIQTLKNRAYVSLDQKRFVPSEQGRLTSKELDAFFHKIINVDYTSKMEKKLDGIAEASESGVQIVSEFYHSFLVFLNVKT